MKKEIKELAKMLYSDLPFYKRWSISKYFKSNNWDVTGGWEECVMQARRMVEIANYQLRNVEDNE